MVPLSMTVSYREGHFLYLKVIFVSDVAVFVLKRDFQLQPRLK